MLYATLISIQPTQGKDGKMRTPSLAVLFLPMFVLSVAATCSAQTVALVDAPLPIESSSSVFPEPAGGTPAYMAVERLPLPATEKKPSLHALDWSMIGAAATLRALDFTSTEAALARPQYFHESVLPKALVENQAGFAAFQAGTVALDYGAYRYLVHHRLRSLARASQYAYVGIMAFQVAHNYQLLSSYPSN